MLIILLNVITTHYVLVISILISVFNIGLSSIHVYNEITPQNFEVFLVAAGAVASTWGCYSSHLSSLHWHPLLKFKPWHHFPPLEASIEMSIDKLSLRTQITIQLINSTKTPSTTGIIITKTQIFKLTT